MSSVRSKLIVAALRDFVYEIVIYTVYNILSRRECSLRDFIYEIMICIVYNILVCAVVC